jgi:hypothetical protein
MTLFPPALVRVLIANAGPGQFTLEASGLVMKDAFGNEVWRVWGTDNAEVDYNAWNFYAGLEAGKNQPTDNFSAGYYNTGIGARALAMVTTGWSNTAIGSKALQSMTDGDNNTAVGSDALRTATTGKWNTAVGGASLVYLTEGSENTALGLSAGFHVTVGTGNTMVGSNAAGSVTIGNANTAMGSNVLGNLTTGSNNTAVGSDTGLGITTGSFNTIIGAGVSGLAGGLSNNVILADGAGNVRAQHNGTTWDLKSAAKQGTYTVATLPAGSNGLVAFATNGRKKGEGPGAGTGSIVIYSNGAWRRSSDENAITA